MGTVLSFSPRVVAGSRPKPNGELAAVIIFPGVRYERLEDTLAETSKAQKRGATVKGPSAH